MGLDDDRSSNDTSMKGGSKELPDTPSTQPYFHSAVLHINMVDECLSLNGVLPVVKGEPSPRISTIVDMPVDSLVVPPDVNHPGYSRCTFAGIEDSRLGVVLGMIRQERQDDKSILRGHGRGAKTGHSCTWSQDGHNIMAR